MYGGYIRTIARGAGIETHKMCNEAGVRAHSYRAKQFGARAPVINRDDALVSAKDNKTLKCQTRKDTT